MATALPLAPRPAHASASGAVWTELTKGGPPNALLGGFTYDARRDRAVFFGGQLPAGTMVDELWEFNGSTWSQVAHQSNWPQARSDGQLADFPDLGRVVLFGGTAISGNAAVKLGDTWEWDGSAWTQLAISGPAPRQGAMLVYDSVHHVLVLFGGTTMSASLNDTWTFDGTKWTQQFPALSPAARFFGAMAFDSSRGRAVLFGGLGLARLGDTWEWDGSDWSQRTTTNSPTPRWGQGLAFDAAHSRTVLFGGDSFPNDNQTWEYDGTNWTRDFPVNGPAPAVFYQMAYDSSRQRVLAYGGDEEGFPPPDVNVHDTWALTAGILPTTTVLAAAGGAYGGSATLQATVTAGGGSPAQGQVTFAVAGGPTSSAHTDAGGIATTPVPLAGMAAGAYPVAAVFSGDSGYASSSASSSLVVSPAPLTVAVVAASRLYGQPNPAFVATFQGLVNGDRPQSLGTLIFTTAGDPASVVGSYPVSAGGLSAPNYSVTYAVGTLQVQPAPLTVQADDKTRAFGTGNPALTATFVGLVNGDQPQSLGQPSLTTSAVASSPVGLYPITVGGLSAPNYLVTYGAGVLTVAQATVLLSPADSGISLVGARVILRLAVTNAAPGSLAVGEGSVTFSFRGHIVCRSIPVTAGHVECRVPSLPQGSYHFGVTYSGTGNLAAASGTLLHRVVERDS